MAALRMKRSKPLQHYVPSFLRGTGAAGFTKPPSEAECIECSDSLGREFPIQLPRTLDPNPVRQDWILGPTGWNSTMAVPCMELLEFAKHLLPSRREWLPFKSDASEPLLAFGF